MSCIHLLYASGSGHTEYVCTVIADALRAAGYEALLTRAEAAKVEDLARGDFLILASGTWNTGGIEGQLHPYMYQIVFKTAKDIDLAGKRCSHIALGDDRYYYTGRAGEYLRKFLKDHNGDYCLDPLTIINEPFGQEEKIRQWCEKLVTCITSQN